MEISTTPPPPEEPAPLWQGGTILPPNSHFSMEVFKIIRPGIPQHGWPVGQPVTGLFLPLPNGMGLQVEFDHLSGDHRRHAEYAVLEQGAALVMDSPAARPAVIVYKTKSWRDVALYALLPLLFAIPIVDGLNSNLNHLTIGASILNFIVLIAAQLKLSSAQKKLAEARFIAHIPTPGMKISVAHKGH